MHGESGELNKCGGDVFARFDARENMGSNILNALKHVEDFIWHATENTITVEIMSFYKKHGPEIYCYAEKKCDIV